MYKEQTQSPDLEKFFLTSSLSLCKTSSLPKSASLLVKNHFVCFLWKYIYIYIYTYFLSCPKSENQKPLE